MYREINSAFEPIQITPFTGNQISVIGVIDVAKTFEESPNHLRLSRKK